MKRSLYDCIEENNAKQRHQHSTSHEVHIRFIVCPSDTRVTQDSKTAAICKLENDFPHVDWSGSLNELHSLFSSKNSFFMQGLKKHKASQRFHGSGGICYFQLGPCSEEPEVIISRRFRTSETDKQQKSNIAADEGFDLMIIDHTDDTNQENQISSSTSTLPLSSQLNIVTSFLRPSSSPVSAVTNSSRLSPRHLQKFVRLLIPADENYTINHVISVVNIMNGHGARVRKTSNPLDQLKVLLLCEYLGMRIFKKSNSS